MSSSVQSQIVSGKAIIPEPDYENNKYLHSVNCGRIGLMFIYTYPNKKYPETRLMQIDRDVTFSVDVSLEYDNDHEQYCIRTEITSNMSLYYGFSKYIHDDDLCKIDKFKIQTELCIALYKSIKNAQAESIFNVTEFVDEFVQKQTNK